MNATSTKRSHQTNKVYTIYGSMPTEQDLADFQEILDMEAALRELDKRSREQILEAKYHI